MQLNTEATHSLESQRNASLAGSKCNSSWKPLTNWRAKNRCHEQGPNVPHHRSHSQTGEPRTSTVSMLHVQFTTNATHRLKSQGQASPAGVAHHESHSLPGGPRTGAVSRIKIQLTTEATHSLKKQ